MGAKRVPFSRTGPEHIHSPTVGWKREEDDVFPAFYLPTQR